jgi:hypothetical protein
MLVWFLDQLHPQAPGLWLALSIVSLLLKLLVWGSLTERTRQAAAIGRWVLIPYLGLIIGGLSPRLLGLSAIDWQATFSLGAGILFFIMAALILVRASTVLPPTSKPEAADAIHGGRAEQLWLAPYFSVLLLSGAEEFHWAFLRGALWEMSLTLPTPPANTAYVAIWLATLVAAAELAVVHISGRARLFKLTLLLASTILFFFTRNFWLCWLLHTIAWVILLPAEKKRGLVVVAP